MCVSTDAEFTNSTVQSMDYHHLRSWLTIHSNPEYNLNITGHNSLAQAFYDINVQFIV